MQELNGLSSSTQSSPYYSKTALALLCPIAAVYTLLVHVALRLTGKLPAEIPLVPRKPTGSKVAIVTGSNTGIGFETAKSLVVDFGYTVVLACRSRDKAEQAAAKINAIAATKDQSDKASAVFCHPLDLTSLESVQDFCRQLKKSYSKVDILVTNAGRGTRGPSENGFDLMFQSNFLGHFVLTAGLLDVMADDARIVNLSSGMHHFCGGCRIDDPEFWKACAMEKQEPLGTYRPSKLAALLFTLELNRRYGDRIRSIAVNPGAVNSDIWRDFPRWMIPVFQLLFLTNRQGSRTSVAAAVADDLPRTATYLQPYWIPWTSGTAFPVFEVLGPYQGHVVQQGRLPLNDGGETASHALWQACEELTGTVWPSTR